MSKLEKIIGMLGSDHDGERASAALRIADMARRRGLTIVELLRSELRVGSAPSPRPNSSYQPYTHYRERKAEPEVDVEEEERELINRLLLMRSKPLNHRERKFMYDTIMKKKRDSDLTVNERRTAEAILARYEATNETRS